MKKFKALLMIFWVLTLLIACQNESLTDKESTASNSELHLSDVYTSSFEDVSEVVIVDGTSGETTIISEKDEIKTFMSELQKMQLEEIQLDDEREGYLWMVILKSGNEEFQLNNYKIGDRYFNTNPEFNDIVAGYLNKE